MKRKLHTEERTIRILKEANPALLTKWTEHHRPRAFEGKFPAAIHQMKTGVILFLCMGAAMVLAESESLDPNQPPILSAKAWCVADGADGRVLASAGLEDKLKAGSTTKMMCLRVVLGQVDATPELLDEWVMVSKSAAQTPGSRAELAEGESIQLRDAIYALMLPSGNDMANALAEHFNDRFAWPGDESPPALQGPLYKARGRFIAEMNRTARQLGMADTCYTSALGDGLADVPTTTAADLLRLAQAVMKHDLYRKVVATKTYHATIRLPDGGERRAEWKNTNKLLEFDCYDGIKTGLTKSAGNCLVATGTHQGKRLFVVVLGCPSDASRTAEARNLFRWGWRITSGAH